jgi:hypothetical protein
LILFMGWRMFKGQRYVMKKSWQRVRYHWRHTLDHFAEWSILFGTAIIGLLILVTIFYILYLQELL